jgi:membrane-associated phospholipid phosphatase
LTAAGEFVLAERRPIDGGAMRFFALGGHGVSGHAAAAALLFAPVRCVLMRGARRRLRWIASGAMLAWAAWVGWSRVYLGMHFAWNVTLGLAIGFFTGSVAARGHRTTPDA